MNDLLAKSNKKNYDKKLKKKKFESPEKILKNFYSHFDVEQHYLQNSDKPYYRQLKILTKAKLQ